MLIRFFISNKATMTKLVAHKQYKTWEGKKIQDFKECVHRFNFSLFFFFFLDLAADVPQLALLTPHVCGCAE